MICIWFMATVPSSHCFPDCCYFHIFHLIYFNFPLNILQFLWTVFFFFFKDIFVEAASGASTKANESTLPTDIRRAGTMTVPFTSVCLCPEQVLAHNRNSINITAKTFLGYLWYINHAVGSRMQKIEKRKKKDSVLECWELTWYSFLQEGKQKEFWMQNLNTNSVMKETKGRGSCFSSVKLRQANSWKQWKSSSQTVCSHQSIWHNLWTLDQLVKI